MNKWMASLAVCVAATVANAGEGGGAGNVPQAGQTAGDMSGGMQGGRQQSEIEFYVSKYDGAELALSPQRCPAPAFPERSQDKREIRRVEGAYRKWVQCYNSFVATLNAAMPPGKLIPSHIADTMSDREFAAAQARMDQAYARLGQDAVTLAATVQAQHDTWLAATEQFQRSEAQRVPWRVSRAPSLPCNGVPSRSC